MEKEKKSSREKKILSGNIPEAHHLLMSLTGLHASLPPPPSPRRQYISCMLSQWVVMLSITEWKLK